MKVRENHRVVVMGAGGVGKTSLVTLFMEGVFTTTYKPTIEDYYRHTVQFPDGVFHTVEILDTSGTHYFPAMRELSIRSGRAFVFVFSLDNLSSFHEVISLWDMVQKIRGDEKIPMVLVGNKADIEERKVPIELIAQTKSQHMNDCPYIETSAMFNRNVVKLFLELFTQANNLGTGNGNDSSESGRKSTRGSSSSNSGHGTPEVVRKNGGTGRKLSRRLSSFGSLPNISLIRRKSSTNSSTKSNSSQKSIDSTNGACAGGEGEPPKTPLTPKTPTSRCGFGRQNSNSSTTSTTSQLASYNNGIKNHHTLAKKSSSVDTPGPSASSSLLSSLTSGINAATGHSTSKGKGGHFTRKGPSGMEQLLANNFTGINELVDDGMAGLKRVVINGIDTISLSDGRSPPEVDPKCTII